ncbi:UNVERIFIED_CONTAM: hypothetical protein GTU68_061024 [Idotea baltica]|nr:hypothetical protein [Idotea baltica]
MLFNSFDFAVFLPIVFGLYWFVCNRSLGLQNVLLLVSSYIFYGWWDPRFLILILFSTCVDYLIGRQLGISKSPLRRKILLWTSIGNFAAAFTVMGFEIEAHTLNLILPVGISFYTFQTLSYTIDVYRGKLAPTKSILQFSAFVSFFPQLVAGPIERAIDLLPQFNKHRNFDQNKATDGLRQILWGLVKKVVIGDNCARTISYMFEHPTEVESGDLFLGAVFFALRCYGDFSGYSDIAIGTARLFGFNLTQNFAFPYFSRDLAEFWRRWHISLSTWLRDYLYIPLGGSRGGKWKTVLNIMLTFTICGFWHGSDWKFVIWGALNGLFLIPLILTNLQRRNLDVIAQNSYFPSLRAFIGMVFTFLFTAFSIIFLRADSTAHAFEILYLTFQDPVSWFSLAIYAKYNFLLLTIGAFMVIEWLGRREQYGLAKFGLKWPRPLRWSFYGGLLILVVYFLFTQEAYEFVYFHF